MNLILPYEGNISNGDIVCLFYESNLLGYAAVKNIYNDNTLMLEVGSNLYEKISDFKCNGLSICF